MGPPGKNLYRMVHGGLYLSSGVMGKLGVWSLGCKPAASADSVINPFKNPSRNTLSIFLSSGVTRLPPPKHKNIASS